MGAINYGSNDYITMGLHPYDNNGGFVRLHGYKVPMNECIRMED